jgi:hypothetical protein
MGGLNQNERLLLCLARVTLSDADRRQAEQLGDGADWEHVAMLARRGGIGGLLASHLPHLDAPLQVKRSMSAVALKIEDTNRRLVDIALKVCTAAEKRGLTVIPFKGAALNLGYPYNDLRLREQSDIDLLARPEQFDELRELLTKLGCRPSGQHEHSRREQHEFKFAYGSERAPLLVELHWTPFFEPFQQRETDEAALSQAQVQHSEAGPIRLLDPVDMMLSLALHLTIHRFREQLKWLVDVAELARNLGERLDADELWRRAAAIGCARAVAYAFTLARELLSAPVPTPAAQPTCMDWMQRLSPARDLVRSGRQPGWVTRTAVDMLIHDTFGSGVRAVTRRSFHP